MEAAWALWGWIKLRRTTQAGGLSMAQHSKALNILRCNEKDNKSPWYQGFTTKERCTLAHSNTQLWRVNFEGKGTPPPTLLFLVTRLAWGAGDEIEAREVLTYFTSWHCNLKKEQVEWNKWARPNLFFFFAMRQVYVIKKKNQCRILENKETLVGNGAGANITEKCRHLFFIFYFIF